MVPSPCKFSMEFMGVANEVFHVSQLMSRLLNWIYELIWRIGGIMETMKDEFGACRVKHTERANRIGDAAFVIDGQ